MDVVTLTSAASEIWSTGLMCFLHTHTCTPRKSPAGTTCCQLCTWHKTPTKHPHTCTAMCQSVQMNEWKLQVLTFWYSWSMHCTEPPGIKSRERLVDSSSLMDWAPQLCVKGTIHINIHVKNMARIISFLFNTFNPLSRIDSVQLNFIVLKRRQI